jgi:hypothetical protein
MTTNQTSQAVEEVVKITKEELKYHGHAEYEVEFRQKLLAIAEKYKRMEEALKILSMSDAAKREVSFQMRDLAEKALDFDPLKP